jgi:hypothetical protein
MDALNQRSSGWLAAAPRPNVLQHRAISIAAATLMLVACALSGACSPSRTLEAARVLRDIESGDRPSGLKQNTPSPLRTFIRFVIDGREHDADLYLPGEPAKAGIVLVPGLTPRGRDDARLVDFAMTLARARFEVMVPDLPRMRALQVTALDAESIVDAARYMDARQQSQPLGVAAVSFAVGPAVIALSKPELRGRVDFFLGIGGYWDLSALITYVTTGYYRQSTNDPWLYRQPKAYGKWVFILSNAERISDPRDQAALLEMARRKLDDKNASINDLIEDLGPDGLAVYALVTNGDPDRVPALLHALPIELAEEIALLDLRQRDLTSLPVVFVLIHDRHDRIIPAEQSEALAAAVAAGRSCLYVVDGLDHAQIEQPGLTDALALLNAISTILRLRDGQINTNVCRPPSASPVTDTKAGDREKD